MLYILHNYVFYREFLLIFDSFFIGGVLSGFFTSLLFFYKDTKDYIDYEYTKRYKRRKFAMILHTQRCI